MNEVNVQLSFNGVFFNEKIYILINMLELDLRLFDINFGFI